MQTAFDNMRLLMVALKLPLLSLTITNALTFTQTHWTIRWVPVAYRMVVSLSITENCLIALKGINSREINLFSHQSAKWQERSYNAFGSSTWRQLCRLIPRTMYSLTRRSLDFLQTFSTQLGSSSVSLVWFKLFIECIIFCTLLTQCWGVWTDCIIMFDKLTGWSSLEKKM